MPDPISLESARVLIVNDDGIRAPGLLLLERLVRERAGEVWVVAPEREFSASSQAITIHHPLRVLETGDRRFSVDGSPADAAMVALKTLMRETPPDLVLSGINRGANIGGDVLYSGTVGAAREAAMGGIPAIALSQYKEPADEARWETSETVVMDVIGMLLSAGWPDSTILNVNVPDTPPGDVRGTRVAPLGFRKPGAEIVSGVDPANKPYLWISTMRVESDQPDPASDVALIKQGWVTVTPIALDQTAHQAMAGLETALGAGTVAT